MRLIAPLLLTGAALAARKKKLRSQQVEETDFHTYVGGKYGIPRRRGPVPQGMRQARDAADRTETPWAQVYPVKDVEAVGGWEVPITEHPWSVYLHLCEFGTNTAALAENGCGQCGGSLISKRWVVTAAHCTRGAAITDDAAYTMAMVGTDDITNGTATDIEKIEEHPYYNRQIRENKRNPDCGRHVPSWHPQFDIDCLGQDDDARNGNNDIAMVKLATDQVWSDKVYPICLPSADLCFEAYTEMMATGWGTTSEGGEISTKLRGVYLPMISLANCRFNLDSRKKFPFRKWYKIQQNMTCAGSQQKSDTCQGDSGGPLLYRDKDYFTTLYGATSWGLGCGRGGNPGVYARVSSFLTWIKEKSGVYLNNTEMAYSDSCRDWASNVAHTAPLDAAVSQLVTDQSLIKSHMFFDNYCVRLDGLFSQTGKEPWSLKLRDPTDCDPSVTENQWSWDGDFIKNGNKCWWIGHDAKSKQNVYVKTCGNGNKFKWDWDSTTGLLTSRANDKLTFRVRANGKAQVMDNRYIPMASQMEFNGTLIVPTTFMTSYCAAKQHGSRFKTGQYVRTYDNKCDGTFPEANWWWDSTTYQIKDAATKKFCWHVKPSSKKRNYIRVTRCRIPRVTMADDGVLLAKSQAGTQFKWTNGFLKPWRNDRLVVQMVKDKRIQVVDIWKSGWSYRVGEVIA